MANNKELSKNGEDVSVKENIMTNGVPAKVFSKDTEHGQELSINDDSSSDETFDVLEDKKKTPEDKQEEEYEDEDAVNESVVDKNYSDEKEWADEESYEDEDYNEDEWAVENFSSSELYDEEIEGAAVSDFKDAASDDANEEDTTHEQSYFGQFIPAQDFLKVEEQEEEFYQAEAEVASAGSFGLKSADRPIFAADISTGALQSSRASDVPVGIVSITLSLLLARLV